MKTFVFLTSLLFATAPEIILVTGTALGKIEIGIPEKEVPKRMPDLKYERLEPEGMPEDTYVKKDQAGKDVVRVEIDEGKVWRLSSESTVARTSEGIGPGVSIAKADKAYGKGETITGEGNTCRIYKRKPGNSFCYNEKTSMIESVIVVGTKY